MTEVEANPHWYRVAPLKIQLRDHVSIHRHHYRNKRWYVLRDTITNKHYRFRSDTYQLIRQLDGKNTIEDICEQLQETAKTSVPNQNEVISLLASLHVNDLIRSNATPDTADLFRRHEKANASPWKKYIKSPLLIRIPLADPNQRFNRFAKLTNFLFSRAAWLCWLIITSIATLLSISYWSDITHYWHSRALEPNNVLLLFLIYPVVKAIHELAHGLAVKRWGGEVHEMGIMFMMFMPLPYVDASASIVFRDKRQRMLVSAAGILAELLLAAIASLVWLSVETGVVRDIAYNVMLIGGISTLLFNGNPLLRFDGYYILSDAIEIPNLASRSTNYYGYLIQKYLLNVDTVSRPQVDSTERRWLLSFGISSALYRLFILGSIVLFLFEKYLVVGLILGAIAVFMQIIQPLTRCIRYLTNSPILKPKRTQALVTSTALVGLILMAIFVVPVPTSTYTQGIVWLPDDAQVRAPADGFIENILSEPQTEVTTGTELIETKNSLLSMEVERIEWQLTELKARLDQQMVTDRVESGMLIEEIDRVTADLNEAKEKVSKLVVVSPANGTFLLPKAHHLTGRFTHKGDVIGYVTDLKQPSIRAVIQQSDIALVRDHTTAIKIRLADNAETTLDAKLVNQVPSATAALPNKSLGTLGGGIISVDPKDTTGETALEDVFLVDIALPDDIDVKRIGTRAHIRFEHESMPIATKIYRGIRQLFLKRFTV